MTQQFNFLSHPLLSLFILRPFFLSCWALIRDKPSFRKKKMGGGGHLRSYDWMEESAGMMILLFYNPGQRSLGDEYCNIHIFLSVLGYLLKQCILFEILLQFSLSPPYTKLKHGKNSGYTRPTLFVGWGWTCVNWKTPQKRKSVPRLLSMIVGQFYAKVINFMPLHI